MASICYYLAWEWINISLEYTAAAWLKLPHFFLAVVVMNLLTHPIFTLFILRFGRGVRMILACELVIFVLEAIVLLLVYGANRWRRTVLAAFLMNATSLGTGMLMDL